MNLNLKKVIGIVLGLVLCGSMNAQIELWQLKNDTSGTRYKVIAVIDSTTGEWESTSIGDVLDSLGYVAGPDLVDDADADPTNELNTLFKLTGDNLQLEDAGGINTVNLSQFNNPGTDNQLLDLVDDALYIENYESKFLGLGSQWKLGNPRLQTER